MKITTILLMILLILVPQALAKTGHMKLLAVSETEDGNITGSIADLYIDIRPGEGRVFIDTYPLTKIDTQISTRFAKEITCDMLEMDCSGYDFFYTIRGESGIIGGPSAGGAIAVLTATILENAQINEEIAMTGTINSGGIIGPIAGLKEKIEAAAKDGIKKVIIPNQEIETNESNATQKDYETKYNITIVKVNELREALKEYNGLVKEEPQQELAIAEEYSDTMKYLAEKLCEKNKELQRQLSTYDLTNNKTFNETLVQENKAAINLTNKAEEAIKKEMYYSAASYCFGANVKHQHLILILKNITKEQYFQKIEQLIKETSTFDQEISKKQKETITDLEAYMVVKERIQETLSYIKDSQESYTNNESYMYSLAYAMERLYSARSWAEFFGKKGKKFELGIQELKNSCQEKIAEAEERYQYARIFFPTMLENIKEGIDHAYADNKKEEYDLCLFKASQAKAEADLIISVLGIEEKQIDALLETKMKVAERNIVRQTKKGVFPIVGYSYYEYAKSLKEQDKSSALLYLEYALELSNLDMYFKEKNTIHWKRIIDWKQAIMFTAGLATGIMVTILIKRNKSSKKKRKKS